MGNRALREDKIVAVFDPRIAPNRVRKLVELLCLNMFYGVGERVYYALHQRKNPYPAGFTDGGDAVASGDSLRAQSVPHGASGRKPYGRTARKWH